MKIAHIGGTELSEELGSKEHYILQTATHQKRSGHALFVYTSKEPIHELVNGVRVLHFRSPFRGWIDQTIHAFVSVLHAALWHKTDVVHLHGALAGLMTPFVRWSRSTVGVFLTLHENETHNMRGWLKRFFVSLGEKWGVKYADEVFVTKQVLRTHVEMQFGRQAVYAPHGVECKRTAVQDLVLRPFGLKSFRYIAMIAPLEKESGVFTLLDAWRKARTERPDIFEGVKLAIVNTGHEDVSIGPHIDDNVVLTGYQNKEALEALYAGARFIVLPTFYTETPAAILTAMSFGKAVIASSIGMYSEITRDHAVLFETGNADELSTCLTKLVDDQMLAASLGHEARVFVEEDYRWDILGREIENTYEKHRALRDGLLVLR